MRKITVIQMLPYALALLAGLAIAYLNTHTDETPFVAIPLLVLTFLFGLVQPRHAWRWALLVGMWVPLSQLLALALNAKLPYSNSLHDSFTAAIPALIVSVAGAYLGVLFHRMAVPQTDRSNRV